MTKIQNFFVKRKIKQSIGLDWFYTKLHERKYDCIDHVEKINDNMYILHPYEISGESFALFLNDSSLNGWDVQIIGYSPYHLKAIQIILRKRDVEFV